MNEITVEVTQLDNSREIVIVKLVGRLDARYSDKIEEKIFDLIENGHNNFIIDMSEISYLGSSGIRVLLSVHNKLCELKGNLKLLKIPDTGIKILKIMEIEEQFDIFDDKDEALNSFK